MSDPAQISARSHPQLVVYRSRRRPRRHCPTAAIGSTYPMGGRVVAGLGRPRFPSRPRGATAAAAPRAPGSTDLGNDQCRRDKKGRGTVKVFNGSAELEEAVGSHIGCSDWHEISRAQVNACADATGDHQWIPIDPGGRRRRTVRHHHRARLALAGADALGPDLPDRGPLHGGQLRLRPDMVPCARAGRITGSCRHRAGAAEAELPWSSDDFAGHDRDRQCSEAGLHRGFPRSGGSLT